MSIYKRGETWWIQITTKNGKRIQQSAGTKIKREAQELHDKIKNDMWRQSNFDEKLRRSWQETVIRWLSEQEHRKSAGDDMQYLRWLNTYLKDTYLDQIDKDMIDYIKAEKLATGVTNNTVNHTLAFIRSVLNKAKNEWEWIGSVPPIKMLAVKKSRIRWITKSEAEILFRELPDHLEAMARFSLATGLRESNVTGLLWEQIDMQRQCAWIHADQAKANKDIAVPLNTDALAVIRAQLGKHATNVFTYKDKPVLKAGVRAWRNALARAGIENFRWHDLRHTWASWHVQSGTPLNALQELGGWADVSMVMRYAHLSSDHLKDYARNVENPTKNTVTNLLHLQNNKA
ncbi:MAG: site-specific integrase [Thiotrichaceae bacterium]|nr:site-specific integrase [Thiotrichaceae bacterium]